MAELFEKALLIGFGIVVLLMFLSFLAPFLEMLFQYNDDGGLNNYARVIDEIDEGILYVIDNPEEQYLTEIEYPSNLNITFYEQYTKYDFLIDGEWKYKVIFYEDNFISHFYHDIEPKTYQLSILYDSGLINVQFN